MTILSAAFLLFLVMDPLGNIPLFLTALKDVETERKKRVIARELVVALLVLMFFMLCGRFVLGLLQIHEPALSVAGGIVLFLIALKMIFPGPEPVMGRHPDGEPFIVPLAIPLVAGPSAISTVLILATRDPARLFVWMLALTCAWAVSAVILLFSVRLSRFFGERGLLALERLMGLLLTVVAVQMLLTGLGQFLGQKVSDVNNARFFGGGGSR
jgi:MarC family membrane protein